MRAWRVYAGLARTQDTLQSAARRASLRTGRLELDAFVWQRPRHQDDTLGCLRDRVSAAPDCSNIPLQRPRQ